MILPARHAIVVALQLPVAPMILRRRLLARLRTSALIPIGAELALVRHLPKRHGRTSRLLLLSSAIAALAAFAAFASWLIGLGGLDADPLAEDRNLLIELLNCVLEIFVAARAAALGLRVLKLPVLSPGSGDLLVDLAEGGRSLSADLLHPLLALTSITLTKHVKDLRRCVDLERRLDEGIGTVGVIHTELVRKDHVI